MRERERVREREKERERGESKGKRKDMERMVTKRTEGKRATEIREFRCGCTMDVYRPTQANWRRTMEKKPQKCFPRFVSIYTVSI